MTNNTDNTMGHGNINSSDTSILLYSNIYNLYKHWPKKTGRQYLLPS